MDDLHYTKQGVEWELRWMVRTGSGVEYGMIDWSDVAEEYVFRPNKAGAMLTERDCFVLFEQLLLLNSTSLSSIRRWKRMGAADEGQRGGARGL